MYLQRIRFRAAFVALAVLCLFLFPADSRAQSTTQGAIGGTVVDTSGAAVAGAAVTLHNDGTNAEFKLTADASGYFKAPLVPPGTYTVTIAATGFGTYSAKAVPVTVGSLTELHPELKTGSTVETVEVTGVAPVLQFASPEVSSTLTAQEIVNLPLNGGRWSDLALLTPGAASDANGFGLISFRGISPILNNVEIDGADNNQAFFSEERGRTRAGYSTSQIAIAEFQVNTGVYSAEYGRSAGGVLNAVTKSGSNSLHGQAYFYDRDNNWGSLNPFTTFTSVTEPAGGGSPTIVTGVPFQPKDWRKRWGFGAGGKLISDKLFWFYAYDQYRRNFPGVAKPATPSSFFNQWADLSLPSGASCTTASATKSGVTTVSAKFTGVGASPGDNEACTLAWRVYGGDYATAAAHYDQLLYGSAVSSVTGLKTPGLLDDLGATPRTGDEVLNTPKLDWQVTPTQHVSVLYHRLRWDSPGGVQTQASNNYAIDSFGTDFVKLDYGLVKLDSLINSNLSNELRVQYGRELNDEGEQPFSSFTSTYLNNSAATPVQLAIYGGSSNYGFTAGMPYYSFRKSYPDERKTQVGDTAIWSHGSHNIKFGFDVLRNTDTVDNLYQSNGVYTYTYFSDFFSDILKPNGACDSTQAETALSTNGVSYPCYFGFTQGFGTPKFTLTTVDYGFFVQDDWKLTPHLTLNIGVRYDNEQVPAPYRSLLDSSLLNTAVNGSGPFPNAQAAVGNQPVDNNNFGPRIGLSWDPFGRGKTVVHTGYGLYYGRIPNGIVLNTYEAAGSPKGQYTVPSIFGSTPSSTVPVFPQVIGTGKFPTPSLDYFAKNFQNPQVSEFDLSVQQELRRGTFVTVSYMGALGRELPNFINVNLNPDTTYQNTLTVLENPKLPGTGCGPVACGTAITSKVYSKNYMNTHYGFVTEIASNINSSYNGLIAEVQNRSNKYVQFDANYTWSHALDFNQNQSTSPVGNSWYDPLANPRANYGNSSFNVPNRFVTWAMLQYPGRSNSWMRFVSDGWHLNPILQIQNGLPYSAGVSGTQGGVGSLKANSSGINGSGNSIYLLQIGRNTYKMPTTTVLDMRLQKDLRVSERFNFELLGEVFNLLNHQNVTGVNATAYSINATASSTTPANTLVYQPAQGAGVNASGFGTVSNADSNFVYSQRQIQLGIKLDF
jgi:outer membrane receptor protein involved in Fe transport